MKLLEVGDEHAIVMLQNGNQVMFHHQAPVAARVGRMWYRGPNANLISQGHVNRYLAHIDDANVHWVSQTQLESQVEAL